MNITARNEKAAITAVFMHKNDLWNQKKVTEAVYSGGVGAKVQVFIWEFAEELSRWKIKYSS